MPPKASAHPAAPSLTRQNARAVAVVWLKQMVKDRDGPEQMRPEWIPATARLLSLPAAAAYVGVSTWVIRGWLADGVLTRVRLPGVRGGEIERLLIDVSDLDRLVTEGKGL
jgi:hypothetical protein